VESILAAAFLAAALITSAPAPAHAGKNIVCAANPTAKVCLKDSAKN